MGLSVNAPVDMNVLTAALLSDDPPPGEAVNATPGTANKARRRDARDKRLTSSGMQTVGANGLTRILFTRTFDKPCHVEGTVVESADNGVPSFVVRQYLKNTGTDVAPVYVERKIDGSDDLSLIVGCDLYGYRVNPVTPTATFTILTLATFLFTGVNAALNQVVNSISGKPTNTPLAQGTVFTYFALAQSTQGS